MNKSRHLFPFGTSSICVNTRNTHAGEALRRATKHRQRMHRIFAMLTVVAGSLAMPATASIVFADNTFDLADYTIDTSQSGGASINISQTLTGGDPGAALQTLIQDPGSPSPFRTSQFLLNSSFLYDPGAQGAIQTIDFMGDVFAFMDPGPLTGVGISAVLFQGGNYYLHNIGLSAVNGIWQTGSQNGLLETDFNLVTDQLTLATNNTSYPDFNNGQIQFGLLFATGNFGTIAQNWDIRLDNISYTVNAVPVPPALLLFSSGLLGLVGVARHKKPA